MIVIDMAHHSEGHRKGRRRRIDFFQTRQQHVLPNRQRLPIHVFAFWPAIDDPEALVAIRPQVPEKKAVAIERVESFEGDHERLLSNGLKRT
jgi:hypothetical protein